MDHRPTPGLRIHVTERVAREAMDSGLPARIWPEDFDPHAAWALAGRGAGRTPTGWGGIDVVSGEVNLDHNRLLSQGEWWGERDCIGYVDRMVREDPILQAMRLAMTLPILSGTWTVEAPEDPTPQEQEATDFLEVALFEHLHADGGWHGWLEQAVQYQWRGFHLSELWWPYDREMGRTLLGMRTLLPWTVSDWLPTADGRYGVKQWASQGDSASGKMRSYGADGATFGPDELLNLRYMPEGDNPSPMGAFRSCWGDYMARTTYRRLEAQGYERSAFGVPIIEVDPSIKGFDGTVTTVASVNKAAQNYRSGLRAANMFPPGYTLKFVDFPFKAAEIKDAIVSKGHAMLAAIHATFLRTGETKGALSLHDSQVAFFATGLQQAADKIAADLSLGRHAPLKRLVAKNFADLTRFPVLRAPEIRIGDPTKLVEAIVNAEAAGVMVDTDRAVEDRVREILAQPPRPISLATPVVPDDTDDEELDPAPKSEPTAAKPKDDEVDEAIAEEQAEGGTKAAETLTLADVSADRYVSGPRGRAVRAAEEVVRYSETRGMTDAGKEEQARLVQEWRDRIAEQYGKELATAATLEDAMLKPVPGKRALQDALAANLRRSYTAGRVSVEAETDRIADNPELQKRIARGEAEVGDGGDLPAPERLSDEPCGCGCNEPLAVALTLAERMAAAPRPVEAADKPDKRKRRVKAPEPAEDMPESDVDNIDPEDSIFSVSSTTVAAAADRVKTTANTSLQSQGTGGAMPDARLVPAIVATAVTALSIGPDRNQAQADVNTVFGLGRQQQHRAEGSGRFLYSNLLESQDVCVPCESHDGDVFGVDQLDEYATPATWCEGGAKCLCLTIGLPG